MHGVDSADQRRAGPLRKNSPQARPSNNFATRTAPLQATVDFSKSAKPAKPPVPLVVIISVAAGDDGGESVIMTWTDPTATISPAASYPVNIWEEVGGGASYREQ